MPIYNASDYLKPALDSALDQTLEELEIICIDDGSTDCSLEIIKEYQERDERVRILTETNAGPALARNNGIRRARGEYIAFLDADDFLEPTFLESLYNLAKSENLDIAISKYDIYNGRNARFEPASEADHADIFADGVVTSKNEYPDCILTSTVGSPWNKLFRRSFVLDKQLTFLTDVRMYEDVYFVVTAMSLAERVSKVNKILMHHRIHSEQSRAKMFRRYYSQVPLVYSKIKEFMVHTGMYAPLSKSFLNLSASRCYKIFNLLSSEAKQNFWKMLSEEYVELLDWQNKEASDFESGDVYEFVLLIQRYEYEEYEKRLAKGKKLKLASAGEKKKGGISGFFAKIFGRK